MNHNKVMILRCVFAALLVGLAQAFPPIVSLSSNAKGYAAMSITASDLIGNTVTTGVVSIVFTPASVMPIGGTITINTPFNYFATRAPAAAAGTGHGRIRSLHRR